MKVDINKEIKSVEGKAIKFNGDKSTVKSIAVDSLLNSGSNQYKKKVELAKRLISEDGEVSLSSEEITLIKSAVKELSFVAQLVYQFEQAIDPVEEEDE